MLGLGSSADLGIGIAVQLQDQFSVNSDRVLGRMRALRNETNSLITQTATSYRNTSAMIAAGSAAVAKGFWGMAKQTSEFGHRINQIDIIGEGRLGKTKKQLASMAQMMGKDFATKPADVASAMFENAKQGITRGMEDITKYQLAVSKATDENLGSVSTHLLHIMNAYGMANREFPRVANAITAAANATTASVTSLGEGMQYAAFPAHQYNIRLEETLALVAKLQQSGINPSGSGTALQNMFTYLGVSTSTQATKKQKEQWKRLGLDRAEMASWMNQGKIFDVVAAIDRQLQGIAPTERAGILKGLMNVRGTRAQLASKTFGEKDKSLEGILRSIDSGVKTDVAMRQSRQMMNDPYGQFLKIQVAWENFKINFITQAAPMVMGILKFGTKVVDVMGAIASTPLGSVFGAIIGIGVPLVGTLFAFRAAALSAAIALRGFGALGLGTPTFRQVLLGQLGQKRGLTGNTLGQPGFGTNPARGFGVYANNAYRGPGYLHDIQRNAAGNWQVRAGQQFHMGNKVYGPGQMLPYGFNPALGGYYSNAHSSITRNAAGNWQVRGGMNYQGVNGRIFGPGQMVGAANAPSMLGGLHVIGPVAATASNTSRIAAGIAGVAGGILTWLPVIGLGIMGISGLVAWMKSKQEEKEKKEADPDYIRFKKANASNLYNFSHPWYRTADEKGNTLNGIFGNSSDNITKTLSQQINIHVDGKKVMEELIDNKMDDSLQKHLHFNISH